MNSLEMLPAHILEDIFEHLGPESLFSCNPVCKQFNSILQNPQLILRITNPNNHWVKGFGPFLYKDDVLLDNEFIYFYDHKFNIWVETPLKQVEETTPINISGQFTRMLGRYHRYLKSCDRWRSRWRRITYKDLFPITSCKFNQSSKIPIKTGNLDLETLTLTPRTKEDMFTYCYPVSFMDGESPDTVEKSLAKTLLVEEFFFQICNDDPDLIKQLHDQLRSCIVGNNNGYVWLSNSGGATTIIKLLKLILGDNQVRRLPEMNWIHDYTDLLFRRIGCNEKKLFVVGEIYQPERFQIPYYMMKVIQGKTSVNGDDSNPSSSNFIFKSYREIRCDLPVFRFPCCFGNSKSTHPTLAVKPQRPELVDLIFQNIDQVFTWIITPLP